MKLTASDLASAISQLPPNRQFGYVNPRTKGKIIVTRVNLPEGPIQFKRFNPSAGGTPGTARLQSISTTMLWRVANAINEGIPLNVDRVLGASYSARSVLEALLAHTPQFHFCYPGRIEESGAAPRIKKGHKHLIWTPESPHEVGVLAKMETDLVISEIPTSAAIYESLILPGQPTRSVVDPTQRRHAQIQIALVLIGRQLGFKTHVARNDQGIIYNKQPLAQRRRKLFSVKAAEVRRKARWMGAC